MVTLKERAHTETVIHQQKDPMDGTRRLKVLKYLRQNTPGNIPRSSVRALEKLPAKVLSTLHAGSDLRQITEDPRLRNWLAANPVTSSKASVQAPLFQGTLVFVQMTFTRPNQLPFSMLAADIQTAVTYATLAVGPIQRYAWQYGPNSVQVSPNILSFTADLQGNTFSDDDLQGWVDSIVQDNNLTNACVVILHDSVNANSPTNTDALSGINSGYHSSTGHGHPYCFCKVSDQNITVADKRQHYAGVLSHEIAEMTVDPIPRLENPEVCDGCFGNCMNFQFDLFDSNSTFISGTINPTTTSTPFTFYINSIIRPSAYDPNTECAVAGSDLTAVCVYPPPGVQGELLSYGDAGTPGNVSNPVLVGFGGWLQFKFLFAGRNAAGQDRIYAVNQNGELLSYGDAGTLGNVSSPVVVGFGGWLQFKFLFAGRNAAGENRIYAVNQNGELLSYGDDGTPGNVSSPVVVGFGGWLQFKFLFAGRNAAGEDRIYAVNQNGELLSYGDDGTPGNVSSPVVVGFGGWLQFKFLSAGRNAAGQDRIYAVNQNAELLSYGDAGTPGNVSSPVVVGFGGWLQFKFLFAGRNAAGQDRIYAVEA